MVITGRYFGFISFLEILACTTHYASLGRGIRKVTESVMSAEDTISCRSSTIATPTISWRTRPIVFSSSILNDWRSKLPAFRIEDKVVIVIDPFCDPVICLGILHEVILGLGPAFIGVDPYSPGKCSHH
jgi:hypothetical protein